MPVCSKVRCSPKPSSRPGLGLYITNSLQNADMNAVLGGTIVIGAIFVGINLFSDLLYRTLDPRTRSR